MLDVFLYMILDVYTEVKEHHSVFIYSYDNELQVNMLRCPLFFR